VAYFFKNIIGTAFSDASPVNAALRTKYAMGALGVSPRKFMKLIENDENIAINDYNHY
jgi:hypothetical protein